MEEMGMLLDVAHADATTLKQIMETSSKPFVDSHTSPCSDEDPSKCGRFRTWKGNGNDAKASGVVCTGLWDIKGRPGLE